MTDIKPDVEIPDLSALPDASPSDPLEALSWLGETVEEVAEGLRARGIKGEPCDPNFCGLAQYLKLWWPEAWVGVQEIKNCGKSVSFSDTLLDFRRKFDLGFFPDLIDNG